ncbi:MAG: 2-isopropylmalate synthase [Clostridia bacterium]|nr:2-isopropylmalate synthase [Clostridia bacterium]
MPRRIYVFDTTLRDGEQSPGVNLLVHEKVEIARQLAKLGVDVIEAGFPITSDGDFEGVRAIAREVRGPVICALARTAAVDIDRAAEAIREAESQRIHVFTSASEIHIKYMLQMTPDEVVEMSVGAVRHAKGYVEDVEFSAQDCMRADPEFLFRLYAAAIEAGATVINIPDTVGYTTPEEYADLIRRMRERVPGADRVRISVHTHNDLGLAVANSLAALKAGADQVECAVNGIGERAGNCSLEEVVMALHTRRDYFDLETGIQIDQIYRTSRLVSRLTGMVIQPNKAVVGDNAFAHESGIHQDGVLKERTTYEIMRAEDIGWPSNRLVLGKHSGRHAFRDKLRELGYELSREEVNALFRRFKALTDRKKEVNDQDIEALVEEGMFSVAQLFTLRYFHISSGNNAVPTATVAVEREGVLYREAALGDGPVDALFRAIDRAVGMEPKLLDYRLRAVTEGKDAQGEVTVKIEQNGQVVLGRGVSTDILEASALAYLHALNKLVAGVVKAGGAVAGTVGAPTPTAAGGEA